MRKVSIYFRNDDPDTFEFGDKRTELRQLTDLFYEMEVPLIHACVPKTITDETVEYFKELKRKNPDLIEFVQHGYQHQLYVTGEFDETRTYDEQYNDIKRGQEILKEKFGDLLFNGFVFPFGGYADYSMKIIDELGFDVLSCYWKYDFLHRLVYTIFRPFNMGPVLGYHISYHHRKYKKFKFYDYSNCVNVLKTGDPYIYKSADEMFQMVVEAAKHTKLIGVVHHYNTLNDKTGPDNLKKTREFLEKIKNTEWIECTTLENYSKKEGHL